MPNVVNNLRVLKVIKHHSIIYVAQRCYTGHCLKPELSSLRDSPKVDIVCKQPLTKKTIMILFR